MIVCQFERLFFCVECRFKVSKPSCAGLYFALFVKFLTFTDDNAMLGCEPSFVAILVEYCTMLCWGMERWMRGWAREREG
jgi:hypothetical protein